MNENDLRLLNDIKQNHPSNLKKVVIEGDVKTASITDSSSRPGFFILQAESYEEMETLLHQDRGKIQSMFLTHRFRNSAIMMAKIHFL